ncbi:MAG: hypothetical protein JSV21_03615 [Nitrospirota bacterium]|nr:MAG: hypothetical protein JSV21_03615 [Nitrospirota bacterium]
MKWSREIPEEDGHYWYLPSGDEGGETDFERCKAVVIEINKHFAYTVKSLHRYEVASFNGYWYGPIRSPSLPSIKCVNCGWGGDESQLFIVPLDDETEQAIDHRRACPKCKSITLETL